MYNFRGGLLASTGAPALAIGARGRYRDGEGDDAGGGGGGGGDAGSLDDLLDEGDDKGGDDKGGDDKGGDDKGGDDKGGDDKGEPPAIADWMKTFSGEAPAEGVLSNQAWLAKTGVKDPDALVQRMRDTEKAFREGGKVKIPGEGATEAEIKVYREAIGVPETVEGYEIKLPEGLSGEKFELDGKFLEPMKAVALAHNVPAKAFAAFANEFMLQQAKDAETEAIDNNAARVEKLKAWGKDAPVRKEEFLRGAKLLDLDKASIMRIQTGGFGVAETMDMFAKIGAMAGEDFFANGPAAERFGVADLESAEKQLKELTDNPETANKIRNKTDMALVGKYKRLIDAVAHFREKKSKE